MNNSCEAMNFTPEVCEKLKYYVYRLVDPRNGDTFYIGKGKGNRVFQHVQCALSDHSGEDDDEKSLKYDVIRSIKDDGLEVIHIIQRYGLTEKEALLVESVLIDAYSTSKLTNKQSGHDSSKPIRSITLQKTLSAKEFDDSQMPFPYIVIKIKQSTIEKQNSRYECTRSAWKLDINKVKQYPYVLSVTDGIVKEVYKATEWHSMENGRVGFTGTVAEDEIRKIFIDMKIPEKYRRKGSANPAQYRST